MISKYIVLGDFVLNGESEQAKYNGSDVNRHESLLPDRVDPLHVPVLTIDRSPLYSQGFTTLKSPFAILESCC